jgi:hypothetical protein
LIAMSLKKPPSDVLGRHVRDQDRLANEVSWRASLDHKTWGVIRDCCGYSRAGGEKLQGLQDTLTITLPAS